MGLARPGRASLLYEFFVQIQISFLREWKASCTLNKRREGLHKASTQQQERGTALTLSDRLRLTVGNSAEAQDTPVSLMKVSPDPVGRTPPSVPKSFKGGKLPSERTKDSEHTSQSPPHGSFATPLLYLRGVSTRPRVSSLLLFLFIIVLRRNITRRGRVRIFDC